jgi:serine/threonine protein kinase
VGWSYTIGGFYMSFIFSFTIYSNLDIRVLRFSKKQKKKDLRVLLCKSVLMTGCSMSLRHLRKGFRDELALLQKIRHPNVVQFLGAVTQSSPMMIVTEYLPKVFPLFISTITRKILSAELLEFSD